MPSLDRTSRDRLAALASAPKDRWVALSADERRLVADAHSFEAVVEAAENSGEDDPVVLRVPEDWAPRIL